MAPYTVHYDQTRLDLANAAAKEEEEQHQLIYDNLVVERSFESAVLSEFHRYQRIDESYTTRLLVLAPGGGDAILQGSLESLVIGQDQEYSALSYVWGPPEFRETILLDGKRLAITPSLAAALKHFRSRNTHRLVWVDQICINQKDHIERNQQVQLMHAIFRKATQVLVWLGPDKEGHAARAFQLCRSICSIMDDELLSSLCRKAGANFDWIPNTHWKSLRELTHRSWFRRVWIPQEIGTETPAQIHWGNSRIEWEVLVEAMKKLSTVWELRTAHDIRVTPITILHRRFVRSPEALQDAARDDFVFQLFLSARGSASDARDYIFSRLGHYSAWVESENSLIIEPDYDNDVHAIYHEVAIRAIKTRQNLLILNVASKSAELPLGNVLPRWVPRWDKGRYNNLIGYPGRYDASMSRSHGARFENDFRDLILKGISVDTITKIGDVHQLWDLSLKSTKASQRLLDAWKMVCSTFPPAGQKIPTNFRTEPKYFQTSMDSLEAFLDTFAPARCVADTSPTTSSYRSGIATLTHIFSPSTFSGKTDPRRLIDEGDARVKSSVWMRVATKHSSNRRFAITKKGYLVMAPPTTRKGDQLCILFGGETPFVLRKSDKAEYCDFVGEAYVPGLMTGEAITKLDAGDFKERTFCIR